MGFGVSSAERLWRERSRAVDVPMGFGVSSAERLWRERSRAVDVLMCWTSLKLDSLCPKLLYFLMRQCANTPMRQCANNLFHFLNPKSCEINNPPMIFVICRGNGGWRMVNG
jgi:hypothetical protein